MRWISRASMHLNHLHSIGLRLYLLLWLVPVWPCGHVWAAGDSHYARSDSDKRFLHHIDLYDVNNRIIGPDSDHPYSTRNTCGRCHDYSTILHGWHSNAFSNDRTAAEHAATDVVETTYDGRPGEPWIWTDARTGTQLPLSYRDWPGRFDPRDIGITAFEMTRQFGARIPGGGVGTAIPTPTSNEDRWSLTGKLEIDCLVCHAVSGAYDFEVRRETIQNENFAWAPTAALRIGTIEGSVSRVKTGSDIDDEKVQAKLPKVTYDGRKFNPDGSVFIDLIRQPENNACYQCHSQRTVTSQGVEARWIHDQDVHLRAGMNCIDCHRNGIDHHIVRGFPGERHPFGESVHTLSCAGCHLGGTTSGQQRSVADRPGRLGSPRPLHEGLPPIHFEKLSCIACHAGPIPTASVGGLMTSMAHGLGADGHRSGLELPLIRGPIFVPASNVHEIGNGVDQSRQRPVTTGRAMWPAYWGHVADGTVIPLTPEAVYAVTRRALRVRKDFRQEVTQVKLSTRDKQDLLGEERGGADESQWTEEEQAKVAAFINQRGRAQFDEKVAAALAAIEKELLVNQAVYVSSGLVFARGGEEATVVEIDVDDPDGVEMVTWPMAHNVRPAGWSLGATGCLECHTDDGLVFASQVTPIGPAPVAPPVITMASLQGIDELERGQWNRLFAGRNLFKAITAASIIALVMALMLGVGAKAATLMAGPNSNTHETVNATTPPPSASAED